MVYTTNIKSQLSSSVVNGHGLLMYVYTYTHQVIEVIDLLLGLQVEIAYGKFA